MWMRVDDGMHAHRKTRAVTKSHPRKARDAAPMGLWVLAGSWAGQNNTNGWVPEDELDRWDEDWEALVARLITAGYWWPHQRNGEPGYGFNDWHDYNDPAGAASKAGTFGNHIRWHVNEGKVEPTCDHCPQEPAAVDEEPETIGSIGGRSGGDSHPTRGAIADPIALPEPLPEPDPSPNPNPNNVSSGPTAPDTTKALAIVKAERPDVARLCDHLADRIAEDGSKRPEPGKGWHDAARLMLDRDGRTEQEIHAAIDWCQSHHFWRTNVLSMPKLREKFDQLRKVAASEQQTRPNTKAQENRDMLARAMERAQAKEAQMGHGA